MAGPRSAPPPRMMPEGQYAGSMSYPQAGGSPPSPTPGFWYRPRSLKIVVVAGLVAGVCLGLLTSRPEASADAAAALDQPTAAAETGAGGVEPQVIATAPTPVDPASPVAPTPGPPSVPPGPPSVPPSQPSAPVSSAPAAPPPPASRTIVLTVDVEPRGASVRVDGDAIDGRYSAEIVPGRSVRVMVEASAPGYAPYRRPYVLDRDRTIKLKLNKPTKKPRAPRGGPGSLIDL